MMNDESAQHGFPSWNSFFSTYRLTVKMPRFLGASDYFDQERCLIVAYVRPFFVFVKAGSMCYDRSTKSFMRFLKRQNRLKGPIFMLIQRECIAERPEWMVVWFFGNIRPIGIQKRMLGARL